MKGYERKDLTNKDIEKALESMPDDEQETILQIADNVQEQVKQLRSTPHFGDKSALELIAKLGIWLSENEITEI